VRSRSLPAALSASAGTYLCNYVFYGLMRRIGREDPALRGGFIHLPYSRALAAAHPGSPFLDLEELVRGVGAALEVLSR
jgi:pyroglutamyl-peptidase